MRISSKPGHPDFNEQAALGRYTVNLDGVPVKHPYFADDEAGEVAIFVTDAHGRFVLTEHRDGVVTDVLRGKVEIVDQWAG